MREVINPPREIADAHTLLAQKYAGYFVGHPYRAEQQGKLITIDWRTTWQEPGVVSDSCVLCALLTDAEAVRRVAGFQWQLDIEATRTKHTHFREWLQTSGLVDEHYNTHGVAGGEILRAFVVARQDTPTKNRPQGWITRPLPLVDLPLRLKRKLCVEWNHLLLSWMTTDGLSYDVDKREFWREVEDDSTCCENGSCIECQGC